MAESSATPLFDLPLMEAKRIVLELFMREYVVSILKLARGNISEAARRAGIERSNFRRIVRELFEDGLPPECRPQTNGYDRRRVDLRAVPQQYASLLAGYRKK